MTSVLQSVKLILFANNRCITLLMGYIGFICFNNFKATKVCKVGMNTQGRKETSTKSERQAQVAPFLYYVQ